MMIMLMLRRAMMISSLIGGALSDKIISMVLRLSKPSLLALIKMFGNKCGAEYLICINILSGSPTHLVVSWENEGSIPGELNFRGRL